MMFHSICEETPGGVSCAETVIFPNSNIQNCFIILVMHDSNDRIFFKNNTILGYLK